MITKFQALVSRESLAEVFMVRCGEAVTVVAIRERGNGSWLAEVEYSDGSRYTYPPAAIEPSRHLLSLLTNGTYNEEKMTWHAVIDGKPLTVALTY